MSRNILITIALTTLTNGMATDISAQMIEAGIFKCEIISRKSVTERQTKVYPAIGDYTFYLNHTGDYVSLESSDEEKYYLNGTFKEVCGGVALGRCEKFQNIESPGRILLFSPFGDQPKTMAKEAEVVLFNGTAENKQSDMVATVSVVFGVCRK